MMKTVTVSEALEIYSNLTQMVLRKKNPLHLLSVIISNIILKKSGPGSSFGIVTDYGMDGPGSNPGGDEIFRPSRPALWLTQPPVKWVPGLSWG